MDIFCIYWLIQSIIVNLQLKIVSVCLFCLKVGKISEKKKLAGQRKIFKLSEKDAEVYFSFVFAKKHNILPQSNVCSTKQVDALSDLKWIIVCLVSLNKFKNQQSNLYGKKETKTKIR